VAYHTKKNYWSNVNCVYIIYSIYETTIPSFVHTEQKILKLYEVKMQATFSGFEWNLNAHKYCSCIVQQTGFKCCPLWRVNFMLTLIYSVAHKMLCCLFYILQFTI
jgi:hypothetical protein